MPQPDGSEMLYGIVTQQVAEMKAAIDAMTAKVGDHEKAAAGMVQAVMAIVDQRIAAAIKDARAEFAAELDRKLEAFKTQDKAEDRKLIAEAITKALDREETVEKRGTVKTPDGVHEMTVTEIRRRK